MATKSTSTPNATSPAGGMPWPARATFEVAKTRRQRQDQYQKQMQMLVGVVLAAALLGGLLVLMSWREAGSTKAVSCADFPEYCVPLVGGNTSQTYAAFETDASRTLDGEGSSDALVARGVSEEGMPFIGNPDAPIQIAEVADFACPHCQDYHDSDLEQIMDNLVLTGQARFELALTYGTGGAYSQMASQVALCAGEQGAFWEMQEELYRLAQSQGVSTAFSLSNLLSSAGDMGLDDRALRECVSSGKYQQALADYVNFANDHGVTGTPTVLVNYPGSGRGWQVVGRDYATLADLVERANANAQ